MSDLQNMYLSENTKIEHFDAFQTFVDLDGLDGDVFRRRDVIGPRQVVLAEPDMRRGRWNAFEAVRRCQHVTIADQSSSTDHLYNDVLHDTLKFF